MLPSLEFCFEINTGYPGLDIDQMDDVESPLDCQRLCQLRPGCEYFLYQASEMQCWLKRKGGNKVSGPGFTFGPRTCPRKLFFHLLRLLYYFFIPSPGGEPRIFFGFRFIFYLNSSACSTSLFLIGYIWLIYIIFLLLIHCKSSVCY